MSASGATLIKVPSSSPAGSSSWAQTFIAGEKDIIILIMITKVTKLFLFNISFPPKIKQSGYFFHFN
jgi:hypothetical protein